MKDERIATQRRSNEVLKPVSLIQLPAENESIIFIKGPINTVMNPAVVISCYFRCVALFCILFSIQLMNWEFCGD
jgi:hypothetical protein